MPITRSVDWLECSDSIRVFRHSPSVVWRRIGCRDKKKSSSIGRALQGASSFPIGEEILKANRSIGLAVSSRGQEVSRLGTTGRELRRCGQRSGDRPLAMGRHALAAGVSNVKNAGRLAAGSERGVAPRHLKDAQPIDADGAPYGNRTRVLALRGPRPGPLDEGSAGAAPGRGLLSYRAFEHGKTRESCRTTRIPSRVTVQSSSRARNTTSAGRTFRPTHSKCSTV